MAFEILKSEMVEPLGMGNNSKATEISDWSAKANYENKKTLSDNQTRVPNFLIETILKIIPDQHTAKHQETRSINFKSNFSGIKSHYPSLATPTENVYRLKTYPRFQDPNLIYQDSDTYRQALHNFTYHLQNWSKCVQLSYRNMAIPPAKYSQNAFYHSPQRRPTHGYFTSPNTSPKRAEVWNPFFCDKKHNYENLSNFREVQKNEVSPLTKLDQLSQNLDSQPNDKTEQKLKSHQGVDDGSSHLTEKTKTNAPMKEKSKDSNQAEENTAGKQEAQIWPAWVYCTRYSDRPSAGPRIRRNKRKLNEGKSPDSDVTDKRARTAFSENQLQFLQKEFEKSQYLTEERRVRLAKDLGLKVAQIKVWFQNKRAKVKKMSGVRNGLALDLIAQGLYNHGGQESIEEK